MDKQDFINLFTETLEISKAKAGTLFDTMINEMQIALRKGNQVKLSNIGILYPKKFKNRKVISNFGTKPKKYTSKGKTKLKFRSSQNIDMILNK